MPKNHQGFTLLELAIVLIILGLLVGGILAGQSLVRSSELHSVTMDSVKFTSALGAFQDKYSALPGDMNDAQSYWGTAVWNGNGNGQVQNNAALTSNEISQFWIHLVSAGMIEGSYVAFAGVSPVTPAVNVPRSKMKLTAWNIVGLGIVSTAGGTSFANAAAPAASTYYEGSYGNALQIGTGTNALFPGGFLRSEEAWNIDIKMDDGRPALGIVRTLESQGNATQGSGCGNMGTAATSLAATAYDLSNQSDTACSLVISTGY